jgi:hypothetical protein
MLNKELKVDVVVMKLIKDIQHHLLSPELVEGWRGGREVRPNKYHKNRTYKCATKETMPLKTEARIIYTKITN